MKRQVKRRWIAVIAAALLVVVAACLVSCGPSDREPDIVLGQGQERVYKNDVEYISSEVNTADNDGLSLEQMWKLYKFYHYSSFDDFYDASVFRNMSGGWTGLLKYLYRNNDNSSIGRYRDVGLRSNMPCLYRSVSDSESGNWADTEVTFFDGRQNKTLRDGEIVVSKYAYYTFYVLRNGLKIAKQDLLRIIDSDDVFAKYVILRNCPTFAGYVDGMALEYFGLDNDIPKVSFTVRYYPGVQEGAEPIDGKVVGYFEVPGAMELAGRAVALNDLCGFNYDVCHTPGFIQRLCDAVKNDNKMGLSTDEELIQSLMLSLPLFFQESEEFGYEEDEFIKYELTGSMDTVLGRTGFIYGK